MSNRPLLAGTSLLANLCRAVGAGWLTPRGAVLAVWLVVGTPLVRGDDDRLELPPPHSRGAIETDDPLLRRQLDDLSRRHDELLDRLLRLEAGQAAESDNVDTQRDAPGVSSVDPTPVEVEPEDFRITTDDGLTLHGEDDWFTLTFHTLVQAQFTGIVPEVDPSPGGFTVPRQRLYFSGTVYDMFSHYTMLQWAYGNYNLLDTYIDVRLHPNHSLRFGHWRSPFLYEMSILPEDKLISTERSVANNTVIPERQTGVALLGSLWEGLIDYQAGIFNGPNHQVPDTNADKDFIGLVDLRPFRNVDDHPFRNLHLVGSLDYGYQSQSPPPVRQYRLSSELDNFGTTDGALQVSPAWLTFDPQSATGGNRFLWGYELVWFHRGWTVFGGLIGGSQVFLNPSGARVKAPLSGQQISLARFLTGEEPDSRSEIRPRRNFDPKNPLENPGAIEVFGRFAHLDVGRELIDQRVALQRSSTPDVDIIDVGATWYLNQYAAALFAWQHSLLGDAIELEPGRFTSHYDLFTVRLQFFF